MLIKTSELIGPALDWAVAKCEGYTGEALKQRSDGIWYTPSTDWAQSGPIIERESVSIDKEDGSKRWAAYAWRSDLDLQKAIGPTLLIAAMRCYVASKLGAEVEIPDDLNKEPSC